MSIKNFLADLEELLIKSKSSNDLKKRLTGEDIQFLANKHRLKLESKVINQVFPIMLVLPSCNKTGQKALLGLFSDRALIAGISTVDFKRLSKENAHRLGHNFGLLACYSYFETKKLSKEWDYDKYLKSQELLEIINFLEDNRGRLAKKEWVKFIDGCLPKHGFFVRSKWDILRGALSGLSIKAVYGNLEKLKSFLISTW